METSLGQQLKKVRLERGLSLAAVAHDTRIPEERLQWLEEDNFAAFGNMVYARGFARNYSQYLGVDASELMAVLPKPVLGGARDYEYLTHTYGPWVEAVARRVRLHIDHPDEAVSQRRRLALILGLVIVLVAAMLWRPFGALSKPLPQAENDTTTSALSPATRPLPTPPLAHSSLKP